MPRPGGPRGGGPMGPMGGGPSIYVNGRAYNRFAPVSGGKNLHPTGGPAETVAVYVSNVRKSFGNAVLKRGFFLGTIIGIRHTMTNSLHVGSFNRKLQIAEKSFKDGKITEQQLAVRRMRAASDYYSYLRKIGYYTEKDYDYQMRGFADSIGVEYEDDTVQQGRTR